MRQTDKLTSDKLTSSQGASILFLLLTLYALLFTVSAEAWEIAGSGSGGGGTWGSITGTLSEQTDLQNALNAKAGATITDVDALPIGYCQDGTTPPATRSILVSTNTVELRNFSGTVDQDVRCVWFVPKDYGGATITFRVVGYVSAATAPANGEIVAFAMACVSRSNSEILSTAVGTPQTSSLAADATYAQYDRIATAYSPAITPAGSISAGETAHCTLTRLATTTDTYGQNFGVAALEIKYARVLAND